MNKKTPNKCKTSTPDGHKMCLASRMTYNRQTMLRFVVSPDKIVVFDVTGKLPGRGMWVHPDRAVVQKAIAKKLFNKSATESLVIPNDLMKQIENALKHQILSLMGLARKGGAVVFGFEAVKKAVISGQADLAFEAADSSEREKDKLYHHETELPVCTIFTREELGQVMGMDAVVHVGILKNKAANELKRAVNKLDLFMQGQRKG